MMHTINLYMLMDPNHSPGWGPPADVLDTSDASADRRAIF